MRKRGQGGDESGRVTLAFVLPAFHSPANSISLASVKICTLLWICSTRGRGMISTPLLETDIWYPA